MVGNADSTAFEKGFLEPQVRLGCSVTGTGQSSTSWNCKYSGRCQQIQGSDSRLSRAAVRFTRIACGYSCATASPTTHWTDCGRHVSGGKNHGQEKLSLTTVCCQSRPSSSWRFLSISLDNADYACTTTFHRRWSTSWRRGPY